MFIGADVFEYTACVDSCDGTRLNFFLDFQPWGADQFNNSSQQAADLLPPKLITSHTQR